MWADEMSDFVLVRRLVALQVVTAGQQRRTFGAGEPPRRPVVAEKVVPGVEVMIAIFGDFRQVCAKN
jgi:hypothetical protein